MIKIEHLKEYDRINIFINHNYSVAILNYRKVKQSQKVVFCSAVFAHFYNKDWQSGYWRNVQNVLNEII